MKRLLRTLFVLLIVLGAASQSIRASRGFVEDDSAPFLIRHLADLNISTTRLANSDILVGQTQFCAQPMFVTLLTISGAEDEITSGLGKRDFIIRYTYLGKVDAHPSKLWLTARWVWASALFDTGLRRNPPPTRLVMVAMPRSCRGLSSVDWSILSR
jgi:hypothetical protein